MIGRNTITITVDGQAGIGKSTLIKLIEEKVCDSSEFRRVFNGYAIEITEKTEGKLSNIGKIWLVEDNEVIAETHTVGETDNKVIFERLIEDKHY